MTRPERMLIFAPVGKDGALTARLLARAALDSTLCDSFASLVREFQAGAGAILVTEEALDAPDLPLFSEVLERQPPWSDVPILLFGGSDEIDIRLHTIHLLGTLGNVTLLGRPLHTAAVISTVRAALRSRRRQYDMRDLLVTVRNAREEAEAANRLKDEFLATLSHELRTPLNAVLGWTMMLRNGQLDASRLSHALGVIDRNARLQAQLIEDLLDVSRIISGKLTMRVGRVALVPLLASALDTVRPAAHGKEIEVEATIVTPDVEIAGDPARLQQVFWNLLTNAVSYTPRGGRISVHVDTAADHARVTVRDTGVGYHRTSCLTSSSDSARPNPHGRGRRAGSGWGWRSCTTSLSCTAAISPRQARAPASAPRSSSRCRARHPPRARRAADAHRPRSSGRLACSSWRHTPMRARRSPPPCAHTAPPSRPRDPLKRPSSSSPMPRTCW